jgi:hypothetical protein
MSTIACFAQAVTPLPSQEERRKAINLVRRTGFTAVSLFCARANLGTTTTMTTNPPNLFTAQMRSDH